MSDIFNAAEKAFLEELTALTRKHRIAIGGCGCCGSPSLYEISEKERDGVYDHAERSPSDFEFIAMDGAN